MNVGWFQKDDPISQGHSQQKRDGQFNAIVGMELNFRQEVGQREPRGDRDAREGVAVVQPTLKGGGVQVALEEDAADEGVPVRGGGVLGLGVELEHVALAEVTRQALGHEAPGIYH